MKIDEIKDMVRADMRELKDSETTVDSLMEEYEEVRNSDAPSGIIFLGAMRLALHLLDSEDARAEIDECGNWRLAAQLLQSAAGCELFNERPDDRETLYRLAIYAFMRYFDYGSYIEKVFVSVYLFRCIASISDNSVPLFEDSVTPILVLDYLAAWVMRLQKEYTLFDDKDLEFLNALNELMEKHNLDHDYALAIEFLRKI